MTDFSTSIIHGNPLPQAGDQIKKCPKGRAVNPYMALLEDADGVRKLEELQDNYDEAICLKADLILSSFNDTEISTGAFRHYGTVAIKGIAEVGSAATSFSTFDC